MTTNNVYLVYGSGNALLYVGHTEQSVERRMRQHTWKPRAAAWVSEVEYVDWFEVDGYAEGLALERTLIADLQPLHNVMCNPRHMLDRGAA